MKPSSEGPSSVKPTREELQARVESLEKNKRSVKHKTQAPPESSLVIRGKIQRLGASSPPSAAKQQGSSNQVLPRGQGPPPMAEVSKVAGLKNPSERPVEPPLEVLPISICSPSGETPSFLLRRWRSGERIALELRGIRTHYLLTRSSPTGLYHPSYGTRTSRGRMQCLLRRLWLYHFRERPPYVQTPLFVRSTILSNYPLILSRFCRRLPI